MTAGSDLVFDHLSHNHIEPRAEYQFVFRRPREHYDGKGSIKRISMFKSGNGVRESEIGSRHA